MDLKDQILKLYLSNRKTHGNFQYTVPSLNTYPHQWLWDSCFHAIVLSHYEVNDAKKELLSLVSKQFENGMIPHIIYWEGESPKFRKIDWGRSGTSTITQPPMLAFAVWEIYLKDKDKKFLEEIYPRLKKYYNYLLKERDPRNHHLIGIVNPDESGEDNSPRFDSLLNLPPKQTKEENFQKRLMLIEDNRQCNFDAAFCMKNFFWVKDVPFNSIMVENLRALTDIALEIRQDRDADNFIEQATATKQAMRTLMFEDGMFYSTWGPDYKKIKVKTWATFAPLFSGVPTPDEALSLVNNHLFNKLEFDLPFLVPTVSKDEQSFTNDNLWRGPVWMSINWFVYKGLKRYGFDKEAKEILDKSRELLELSGFREHYNPETGKGQGAENFTWGGLVLDMMAE